MTSENNVDFYCLDCLPSFRAKSKLELHKRACANKDFCSVNMTSEITKLLEFNQYQKSGKTPFIIYADLECIIEKINGCTNNHENSSTTKVSKHIPSSFSMPTKSLFRSRENKHNVYRGKDYMKKFSEFLKEHAMKIINFKKKKKQLLTKEQHESYENSKICCVCKEKFENKYFYIKKYLKVRDHCHCTGEHESAVHSMYNLKYSVPKKIPILFHNRLNFDNYFVIKELTEKFKKHFTQLGENTEKYIILAVPIEKKITRIDKSGDEITKMIPYILQFLDSTRFMANTLSILLIVCLKEFTELNVN